MLYLAYIQQLGCLITLILAIVSVLTEYRVKIAFTQTCYVVRVAWGDCW